MNEKIMKAAAISATAALGSFPVSAAAAAIALIAEAMIESQKEVKAAEDKGTAELDAAIAKQQRLMEFQSEQARVAQEMAIAQRIAGSDDVEIEEFYDESGELAGEVGGSAKAMSAKVGAKRAQQRVVRRIYKFKGNAVAAG